jgi:hypothetical protein
MIIKPQQFKPREFIRATFRTAGIAFVAICTFAYFTRTPDEHEAPATGQEILFRGELHRVYNEKGEPGFYIDIQDFVDGKTKRLFIPWLRRPNMESRT